MTAKKSTLRPRRRVGTDGIPEDLRAWFAGETPVEPEAPPLTLSDATRATLERFPPESLSRAERRALGLSVEPRQPSPPWSALLYPDYVLLRERWQAWAADHPGAKPPAGYERIGKPPPENMDGVPYAEAVAQARKLARRGK